MLRLDIPTDAFWVDCPHGVRLLCRPLTTPLQHASVARATRRMREMQKASPADPAVTDPDLVAGTVQAESLFALGDILITAWEGVFGADGMEVADLTPDNVRVLLSMPEVAAAFNIGISAPLARMVTEGNG